MFLLYLHAISVSNSKASAADASHGLHMDFSTKVKKINIVKTYWLQIFSLVLEKKFARHTPSMMCAFIFQDYYAIQEIQSDKNVFRLIVGYVGFVDTRQGSTMQLFS